LPCLPLKLAVGGDELSAEIDEKQSVGCVHRTFAPQVIAAKGALVKESSVLHGRYDSTFHRQSETLAARSYRNILTAKSPLREEYPARRDK
jgi:hypothetical protein